MENVFNVRYNSKLDRLEVEKESEISKLVNVIKKHKFFSIVLISFLILSGINFYLIFNFIRILESI